MITQQSEARQGCYKNTIRSSLLQVSSPLQLLYVLADVLTHLLQARQNNRQLPPERQHQSIAETDLSRVVPFKIAVFEVGSDLQAQLLFLPGDLMKLVADQCSPIHVVVKVQTGVADVAGVKQLFDYKLNESVSTIECSPSKGFLLFANCFSPSRPLKCRATSVARMRRVMSLRISAD